MNSNLGSSSMGCSGSFSKVGWGAFVGIEPVLVNTGDFFRNSERAAMPSLVPRISGRAMVLDTFSRMSRCWLNLLHSWRMCSLVSSVSLSQGQAIGSWERGRKERRNSPVACAALCDAPKDFTVVLEVFEVRGRVEGRFDPVGYRVSTDFG